MAMTPQVSNYRVHRIDAKYLKQPTVSSKLYSALPKDDPRRKGYRLIQSSKHRKSEKKGQTETTTTKENSKKIKITFTKKTEEKEKAVIKTHPVFSDTKSSTNSSAEDDVDNILDNLDDIFDNTSDEPDFNQNHETILENSRKRLRSILEPEPVAVQSVPSITQIIDQQQLTNIINRACNVFNITNVTAKPHTPPKIVEQMPLIIPNQMSIATNNSYLPPTNTFLPTEIPAQTLPFASNALTHQFEKPALPVPSGLEQSILKMCETVFSQKIGAILEQQKESMKLSETPPPEESSFERELRRLKTDLAASKESTNDEILNSRLEKLKSLEEDYLRSRVSPHVAHIEHPSVVDLTSSPSTLDSPLLKRSVSPFSLTKSPIKRLSPVVKQLSKSPLERTRSPENERAKSPTRFRARSPIPVRARSPIATRSPNPPRARSPVRARSPMRPKSPARTRLRSRSPLKSQLRSRSPMKTGVRSKSPYKSRNRSRSPFMSGNRSRSPFMSGNRSRSPYKSGNRSRSPFKTRLRSRSPIKARLRSRSPIKARLRSRSPIASRSPSFRYRRSRSPGRRVRSRSPPRYPRSKSPVRLPRPRSPLQMPRARSPIHLRRSPGRLPRSRSPIRLSRSRSPVSLARPRSPVRRRSRTPRKRSPPKRYLRSNSRSPYRAEERLRKSPIRRRSPPKQHKSRSPQKPSPPARTIISYRSLSPKPIEKPSVPKILPSKSPYDDIDQISLSSKTLPSISPCDDLDRISLSTSDTFTISSPEDLREKLNRSPVSKKLSTAPIRLVNINTLRRRSLSNDPTKIYDNLSDMDISDGNGEDELIQIQITNDSFVGTKNKKKQKKDKTGEVTSTTSLPGDDISGLEDVSPENHDVSSTESTIDEFPMHCPICDICIKGSELFELHIQSEEHKQKQFEMSKQHLIKISKVSEKGNNMDAPVITCSKVVDCSPEPEPVPAVKATESEATKSSKIKTWSCEICKTGTISSIVSYNAHVMSRKHHRKLLKSLDKTKLLVTSTNKKSEALSTTVTEEATSTTTDKGNEKQNPKPETSKKPPTPKKKTKEIKSTKTDAVSSAVVKVKKNEIKLNLLPPPRITASSPLISLTELFRRLKTYQQLDEKTAKIIEQIESLKSSKSITVNRTLYELKDGLLTKFVLKTQEQRIVVPHEGRSMILHNYHRIKGNDQHSCMTVTFRKIYKYYTWPSMYNDILEYVKKCKECIKYQQEQGGSFYFQNFYDRQLPVPEHHRPHEPYYEEYEYDQLDGVSILNRLLDSPVFDINFDRR